MGKKNNGGKHMSPMKRSAYLQEQGKRYGVSKDDYNIERSGGGRYDQFNERGYEKEIMRRAELQHRDTLRDAQDSGNKHFDDLKGVDALSNAGELIKFDRAMQKYGKKELGQKNTSSVNDFGNIRNSLYDKSREKYRDDLMSDMDDRYATADKLNALQDKIKERAEQSGPVEISSTLTNAQRNVGEFEEDLTAQGANIFGAMGDGNDLEQATDEVMAQEASGDGQDYKTNYSANVKGGLNLSGIKTRGPGSGINGEGF
jgi:hypothetical protein